MYCSKFDTNMASIPWTTGWKSQFSPIQGEKDEKLFFLKCKPRLYFQIVPNSLISYFVIL